VREPATPQEDPASGPTVLETEDLRLRPGAQALNVMVHRGELLGVAGLDGHGQEEFLETLCGLRKPVTGEIWVDSARQGRQRVTSFHGAARAGIAYLPRDRKSEGIMPTMSVLDNFGMVQMAKRPLFDLLHRRRLRRRYNTYRDRLSIVTRSPSAPITSLSGGNQQKVLLARWMATGPAVMLLNDPTRGVDAATRLTIHDTLRTLAGEGAAVVLLSTELEELVLLCRRILVFREGALFAELPPTSITMPTIVAAMFGRSEHE
jgi:ribose transport system ATP-binding protein